MRRVWHVVGTFIVAGLFVGCGDGGGESTATPDNLEVARDAAKKMQLREAAAKLKTKSAPTEKKGVDSPEPQNKK
jgi:hypothetical protein